jgi:hypothetical protein
MSEVRSESEIAFARHNMVCESWRPKSTVSMVLLLYKQVESRFLRCPFSTTTRKRTNTQEKTLSGIHES